MNIVSGIVSSAVSAINWLVGPTREEQLMLEVKAQNREILALIKDLKARIISLDTKIAQNITTV